MQTKNTHLKKKWHLKPIEDFLFFFYTGSIKADSARKLHRLCKIHAMHYACLPSAFKIKSLFYAQGPAIASVVGKDFNFSSYKSLTSFKSTAVFKRDRAFPSSFLEDFKACMHPKDFCTKFVEILSINQAEKTEMQDE